MTVPKPPEGFDSWIEYALADDGVRNRTYARAELAELQRDRQRLDWLLDNAEIDNPDTACTIAERDEIDKAMSKEQNHE